MPSSATRTQPSAQAADRTGRSALVAAACIAVATAVNLALFAIGRGTDATLRVDPGLGEPNHLIVGGDVAWKTVVPLALGALVVSLVARRSRRWTTIVIVAGAAAAGVSIPFVVTGAHDTTTGVLLAGMHTVAGLTFVAIGTRAHRVGAVDGRG